MGKQDTALEGGGAAWGLPAGVLPVPPGPARFPGKRPRGEDRKGGGALARKLGFRFHLR